MSTKRLHGHMTPTNAIAEFVNVEVHNGCKRSSLSMNLAIHRLRNAYNLTRSQAVVAFNAHKVAP